VRLPVRRAVLKLLYPPGALALIHDALYIVLTQFQTLKRGLTFQQRIRVIARGHGGAAKLPPAFKLSEQH